LITTEIHNFKKKAIQWANQQEVCLVLDNNESINAFGLHHIKFAMACGVKSSITGNNQNDFEKIKQFKLQNQNEYVFGYFTYDLKNQLENLQSNNFDGIQFPSMYFFVPEHLLIIDNNDKITFISSSFNSYENWLEKILNQDIINSSKNQQIALKPRVSENDYLKNVEKLKQHIIEGDVYEINYCIEFFNKDVVLNPLETYLKLQKKSPVPFGSYLKLFDKYLICASPERFLCKENNKLYSQPIKGTIKRNLDDSNADEILKQTLKNSEKEQAENLMIVDLVRNDLAQSAKTGSIKVEELFSIYSFQQVHQMISTVSCQLKENANEIEAIKKAFPMGSMTGAPKIMAMELIEKYEETKRGLYSGSIGYFKPNGDFDFNVVIRSVQYNESSKYLNTMVGGAITFDSVAKEEYNECLLKAKAIFEVLN
jgi:para-aminobenzoate synthetase component 1